MWNQGRRGTQGPQESMAIAIDPRYRPTGVNRASAFPLTLTTAHDRRRQIVPMHSQSLPTSIWQQRTDPADDYWRPSSPPLYPPPLDRNKSPYGCIPLPRLTREEVVVHPLLDSTRRPSIAWDITTSPSLASCIQDRHNDHWWNQPATMPAVQSLVIRCLAFDRPVVVFPSTFNNSIVTVWDVLNAVHQAQREGNIFVDDQSALHAQFGTALWSRERLHRGSHVQPAGRVGPTNHSARRDDLRVGDVEEGRTTTEFVSGWRWAGLTPRSDESDVWDLSLA